MLSAFNAIVVTNRTSKRSCEGPITNIPQWGGDVDFRYWMAAVAKEPSPISTSPSHSSTLFNFFRLWNAKPGIDMRHDRGINPDVYDIVRNCSSSAPGVDEDLCIGGIARH
jgi:hypothetical protein